MFFENLWVKDSKKNLTIQLNALYEVKDFMEQFIQNLCLQQQTYQNKISGMRDAGMPLQIADTYCNDFGERNNQILSAFISNLQEVDYPYILRQIEAIELAIQTAVGSSISKSEVFKKGIENIRNMEKNENTIIKECAMCGKSFETTFAQNSHCPECFAILLKNKNAYQNERER